MCRQRGYHFRHARTQAAKFDSVRVHYPHGVGDIFLIMKNQLRLQPRVCVHMILRANLGTLQGLNRIHAAFPQHTCHVLHILQLRLQVHQPIGRHSG